MGGNDHDGQMVQLSRRTFLALSATVVIGACSSSAKTVDSTPTIDASESSPVTPVTPTASEPPSTQVPATQPETTAPETTAPDTTAPETTEPVLPGPVYAGTVDPFTLGVACGDPTPDAIILWTRLAPDPLNGGGLSEPVISVFYDIAAEVLPGGAQFAEIFSTGVVGANAEHAHSVHADISGLQPSTRYVYRFRAGTFTSPVGRLITSPKPGVTPERLVIASTSCQHYETGFYAAHRDIAASDVDLVTFLGDYIYEGTAGEVGGANVRTHGTAEPMDLVGYRNRYALYKSDPDLQSAHARCPWLIIWDDHEVENNYANLVSQDDAPTDQFRARRAAAYQAWWEHQPVRLPAPTGADYTIYRTVDWGSLARFTLLDTRQYRTDQACGDVSFDTSPACAATFDPARTMTGPTQEAWLFDQLDSSAALWNVITQQVIFGNTTLNGAVLNYDQWDGYPVQRDRILQHLADAKTSNPIVLSGDIHFAGVGNLREPGGADQPLVGVEFVCTSISSAGLVDDSLKPVVAQVGDIVDVELGHRGWTKHTITPSGWLADLRIVADVTKADSEVTTYRSFDVAVDTHSAIPTT